MEHHRLRKYRGPETWARVRAAYEAGETGASVARRFDVGLANLRKKARLEGWSRKDTACRLDRELEPSRAGPAAPPSPVAPVEPRTAVEQAMRRAGGLLAEGRGGEAQTLIRSAESLARLVDRTEQGGRGDAEDDGELDANAVAKHFAERDADIIDHATRLAWSMLRDEPMGEAARYSAFMYHWRARHLGPEATASDFAHAVNGGWAPRYFHGDGELRPLPEPITPLGMMVDQYLRLKPEIGVGSGVELKMTFWTMDLTYPGPIKFRPPTEPGIG